MPTNPHLVRIFSLKKACHHGFVKSSRYVFDVWLTNVGERPNKCKVG
jgi:hypothetical protein